MKDETRRKDAHEAYRYVSTGRTFHWKKYDNALMRHWTQFELLNETKENTRDKKRGANLWIPAAGSRSAILGRPLFVKHENTTGCVLPLSRVKP
jgi:hypothetical protein